MYFDTISSVGGKSAPLKSQQRSSCLVYWTAGYNQSSGFSRSFASGVFPLKTSVFFLMKGSTPVFLENVAHYSW